jgi:hypothetical protein
MKKTLILLAVFYGLLTAFTNADIETKLERTITIDSLGACQGISYQTGRIFLYGDREVGMIREFKMLNDSLIYQQHEIKLTKTGRM